MACDKLFDVFVIHDSVILCNKSFSSRFGKTISGNDLKRAFHALVPINITNRYIDIVVKYSMSAALVKFHLSARKPAT